MGVAFRGERSLHIDILNLLVLKRVQGCDSIQFSLFDYSETRHFQFSLVA